MQMLNLHRNRKRKDTIDGSCFIRNAEAKMPAKDSAVMSQYIEVGIDRDNEAPSHHPRPPIPICILPNDPRHIETGLKLQTAHLIKIHAV
jgi:hypothetical protein